MLLNSLIFLLTFSSVISNFETDYKYMKQCNETSPISIRTMNEALINKKLTGVANEDVNFRCFLHCLFTQYGWMDDEGGFEFHKMKSVLEETGSVHPAQLEYILYTCTAIKSIDRCERAMKFIECFWARFEQVNSENEKFFYSLDEKK